MTISSIAANRFLKKEQNFAYYSSFPLIECYTKFEHKNSLSFSSFYKYLGNKYKKAHGFSDLCSLCEKNKVFFIFICMKSYNIIIKIFIFLRF